MDAEVLFRRVKSELSQVFPTNEANQLAYILLEDKWGIDKLSILKKQAITNLDELVLAVDIEALKQHTPVQYVTGKVNFCGNVFRVDKSVLIPRPETEELVNLITNKVNQRKGEKLKVLDIGTGSGCIAISLAVNFPQAEVYALDVSREALTVARENALLNNVAINFIEADILDKKTIGLLPKVDVLVSNPPYVLNKEKKVMDKNVLDWEPSTALFVEDNHPLLFYERIANLAERVLKADSSLYFEINENYGEEVKILLNSYHFIGIKMYTDFRDKNRFIEGKFTPNT